MSQDEGNMIMGNPCDSGMVSGSHSHQRSVGLEPILGSKLIESKEKGDGPRNLGPLDRLGRSRGFEKKINYGG